jgi:dolichol-phosphate mannosyltransferase
LQNTNHHISIILPTLNEVDNICSIIKKIINLSGNFLIEIIVVDDASTDGTTSLVKKLSQEDNRIRLINRYGRNGLSSAIKEGTLSASGDVIAVMDTDGQHQVESLYEAIEELLVADKDLIIGSRFLNSSLISGLSDKRKKGSLLANSLAKFSLSREYSKLTDIMSGFIVFKSQTVLKLVERIDVNGFKFLYELLSVSKGTLDCNEIPLNFMPRKFGESKLDIAIVWDFLVSLIHSLSNRLIPRKAISFAFVGITGVLVQFLISYSFMWLLGFSFQNVLPIAVVSAATSNYLVNNWLTFRVNRLRNKALFVGLLKFLLVSSLPIIANVGLASSFYKLISPNTFFSQLAGIIVVFIWNYAASSKLVWKI